MKNNKKGSFSAFLCIIFTCLIVMMSILLKASEIRCEETLITGALVQQQDLVLSGYSEKLLDWYGIYATNLYRNEESAFFQMVKNVTQLKNYSCVGIDPLDKNNRLISAVVRFSRIRMPLQLSLQLLSRFTEMDQILRSQNPVITPEPTPEPPKDLKEEMDQKYINPGGKEKDLDFNSILNLLQSIDKAAFDTQNKDDSPLCLSWEEFGRVVENDAVSPEFEPNVSKEMKSSLSVTETNLNEISSFIEQFYQVGGNPVYDKLAFEFYITNMFSCKVNTFVKDGVESNRKDMRSRNIKDLPVKNTGEIEKIIFGYEKEETNLFLSELSIKSVRFLCHLVTNMTDNTKKTEVKSLALAANAAIALVSGGTVVIPQSAMEVVLLILMSMKSAADDYTMLLKGESVPLIPAKTDINLDTVYTDYLQLLLLAVPDEVKVSRMMVIIQDNLSLRNAVFYTGAEVSVKYRDVLYEVRGKYDQ